MIIDKLYERVKERGVVCVGLDTDYGYLPESFANNFENIGEAVFHFNKRIIDATLDIAACFKVQIAYYEAYGLKGMEAYAKTLKYLKEKDAVVIADVKRGDIAKTAEMYAKAHFEGDFESDFITLNPYMGMDTIEPFLPYLKNKEKGIFALVRTSNPGSEDIQYINSREDRRIYNIVGNKINSLGKEYRGLCGYSSIGAVVGCTYSYEAEEIRKQLDSTFFLIPGYGAQGGKAKDVALYLKDGNGGVVNSSRAILLAYRKNENGEKEFDLWAREEAIRMRDEISDACRKAKEVTC
ncbi:MAG: orotidine-5'-phosphate decarboxylase [Clostridiales bacterium]|uniref:orotidine-5'-phosphate decarboxylase n=1 Tax=Clostridium sp. N3C TaxID=1776758 RepID=UPI00092DF0AD|nr:orotidine-5'-phosphate decarboxylase [Clostridium sp. N3C]NLZ49218.1 orotidine-5'-phosphate decarboxylase [Clostridiales bacterium]SCN22405.1 orotidine 5'-phosphate decarboxylase [Clostridium sp. N3C]